LLSDWLDYATIAKGGEPYGLSGVFKKKKNGEMMKSLLMVILFIFTASSVLGACSPASLNSSEWRLVEQNGTRLPVNIAITLTLDYGKAGGTAACNGYGAEYTLTGRKLTFENIVSTLMYCDGIMEYESEYLAALTASRNYRLEDGRLVILDDSQVERLVFENGLTTPSLDGSSWKIAQVGELAVPEDLEVTLAFAEDQLTGKAGCNSYFAAYSQEDSALKIEAPGSTKMYCQQAGVMELESAFLSALEKVRSFRLEMGRLVLLDESGAALITLKP